MGRIIYSEHRIDYKYQMMLGDMVGQYKTLTSLEVLKLLFLSKTTGVRYYFHIRYIKWKGPLFTIPYYLMALSICKLRRITIVWTCHNIYEYRFKSKWQNDILRQIIFKTAKDVVVIDENLKSFFSNTDKIHVANYSDLKPYVESFVEENTDFSTKYETWLEQNQIQEPDVLFVSTLPDVSELISIFSRSTRNILFIAPKSKMATGLYNSNTYLYSDGFVRKEIAEILEANRQMIGLIGLDNGSVATSIYMFPSFNIPVLVLNRIPMNNIVDKHKIGLTFDYHDDIDHKIDELKNDYNKFASNCRTFLEENSWEKAYDLHRSIFR